MSDLFLKDSRDLYQVAAWLDFPWLDHGFGTRQADVWSSAVTAVSLKQVHSDVVVRVVESRGCVGEGDGLITNEAGVYLTIRTADCIPVLIVDPIHRAVAAVHAGWRGSVASIVAKTVDRLRTEFASEPAELLAAIGPGIGHCCYEVGPDVAGRFSPWLPELGGCDKPAYIDLMEVNRLQLAASGVREIFCMGRCTRCDGDEFHSFRRDGDRAGRMISRIMVLS